MHGLRLGLSESEEVSGVEHFAQVGVGAVEGSGTVLGPGFGKNVVLGRGRRGGRKRDAPTLLRVGHGLESDVMCGPGSQLPSMYSRPATVICDEAFQVLMPEADFCK